MTLQNIKNVRQKEGGFTIVELLIVIVIIAILATLIIVAYTGIQNRARLTKNQDDAANIDKKAEAYAADTNGAYPTTTALFNGDQTSSLPSSIAVNLVTTAATNANAAATTGGVTTYSIKSCAGGGIIIYYPDPSALSTANAPTISTSNCP